MMDDEIPLADKIKIHKCCITSAFVLRQHLIQLVRFDKR